MDPAVQVIILDSNRSQKCEVGCGLNWSSPELLQNTQVLFQRLYEDSVRVEYLDLDNSQTRHLYSAIVRRVEEENLPLPLLMLNGRIRLSGYFDLRMLQDAIQAEMELSYGREL